jgi:hypothetical protein
LPALRGALCNVDGGIGPSWAGTGLSWAGIGPSWAGLGWLVGVWTTDGCLSKGCQYLFALSKNWLVKGQYRRTWPKWELIPIGLLVTL